MNCRKILNSCVCNKLDLPILEWQHVYIFRGRTILPITVNCLQLMPHIYEDNGSLCSSLNNNDGILYFSQIRTAGLEQEIENLKKQLATCIRQNQNLQEELSEAYRIKVRSSVLID